jgi:hypothetical protein
MPTDDRPIGHTADATAVVRCRSIWRRTATLPSVVAWGDVPTWVAVGGAFLGGWAALRQLRLQRIQFADQTRLEERRQADAIDVRVGGAEGGQLEVLPPDKSEPVHVIIVSNNSHRPIREVACKIEAIHRDGTTRHDKLADIYGIAETVALGPGA